MSDLEGPDSSRQSSAQPPAPPIRHCSNNGNSDDSQYRNLPSYGNYQPRSVRNYPGRRPGTVSAAAWLTIILSSISIICGIICIVAASPFVDYIFDHPSEFNLTTQDLKDPEATKAFMIITSAVFIFFSAAAISLGICVLYRQQWARIVLTVLSGLAILPAMFFSLMLIGIPWLIVIITTIVLLYVGGANAWFSANRHAAAHMPPPGPQAPGRDQSEFNDQRPSNFPPNNQF